MTAQIPETLILDGQELAMCSEPLGDYFRFSGTRPALAETCTALWRGYVGTWEIRDDRLYLIGIAGEYQDGSPVTLDSLFPGYPERVFAHWFSRTLRCPRGGQLEYVHMGYGSVYEEDLLLHVERGVLKGQDVRVNGTAAPGAPQGYGVGACVTFARDDDREREE
jgi:hypothetical protein